MRREEAINLLGWLKSKTNRDDDLEAIDMAIEALSVEPTGDIISRADAVNTIKRYKHRLQGKGQTYGFLLEEFEHQIPSAEAVQGEWIKHKGEWVGFDFYPTKYECSQCHYYVDEGYDSIFCPNCGARMKGGDE